MNRLKDEQAERAVLDVIVVQNTALDEVSDVLEAADFGHGAYGHIYAAMQQIHASGRPVDPFTLKARLEQAGHLEEVGLPLLYELGSGTPKSTNVQAYAQIVRDKSVIRRLRHEAARLMSEADAGEATAAQLLEQAEAAVFSLTNTATRTDWISGSALAAELYPVIERMTVDRTPLTGVASGFVGLDHLTRGWQPGDLILLGARPSQGKTAFARQAAHHAARVAPVAFFSIEMSRQAIGLRAVIAEARVDGWRLMTGLLSDVHQRQVGEGLAALAESKIWVDESPRISPIQVRSKLRRLVSAEGKAALVVVDYVQLMAALPEDRRENKTNQVAGISRALKLLAKEFGTPFLVLSQLHRVPEDRPPRMDDLRDSGALEQDADVVLLLHRDPKQEGVARVIIGKQRNGPTGAVELVWRPESMRFDNLSPRLA